MRSRQKLLRMCVPFCTLLGYVPEAAAELPVLVVEREPIAIPQDIIPARFAEIKVQTTAFVPAPPRLLHDNSSEIQDIPVQSAKITVALGEVWQQVKETSISWERACSEFGYPAEYAGRVRGETRVDYKLGVKHDWMVENNCAPAMPQFAMQEPVEVKIASVPALQSEPPMPPEQLVPAAVSVDVNPPAVRHVESESSVPKPVSTVIAPPVLPSAPPVVAQKPVGEDGQCGSAAAAPVAMPPAQNLCASGNPSSIVGQGPWQWECRGTGVGASATCVALLEHQAAKALAAVPASKPQPQLALSTPQLKVPTLTATSSVRSAPLAVTALATPRLTLAPQTNTPAPGVVNYVPAPPIRSVGQVQPPAASTSGLIDPTLSVLKIEAGKDTPDDVSLAKLETLGQKLALNRLAKITVTAYASLEEGMDARDARRLSLARAIAVRDALMMGGASSDQIRMRALGANVSSGEADRVDLSDH